MKSLSLIILMYFIIYITIMSYIFHRGVFILCEIIIVKLTYERLFNDQLFLQMN